MKKIISILLAMVCIASLATVAFATEPEGEVVYTDEMFQDIVTYTNAIVEPEPDAINEPDMTVRTFDPVANVYFCTGGIRAPYFFGHAWICIENISDEPITVGPETIAPGKMMSTGLYHKGGRTFNMEMSAYRGRTVKALKRTVSEEELRIVENEIMNSRWNWYELFAHNCTNYATSIWEALTGEKYLCFCFPFVVSIQFPSSETIQLTIR